MTTQDGLDDVRRELAKAIHDRIQTTKRAQAKLDEMIESAAVGVPWHEDTRLTDFAGLVRLLDEGIKQLTEALHVLRPK